MQMKHKIYIGDAFKIVPTLEPESVDLVCFSPPYYGLRDYGEETKTVFGGDKNCEHEWKNERMTLTHENRNFQEGTQEEVYGKKGTTYIKKYDDSVAGLCSKCSAWFGFFGLEPHPDMYIQHLLQISKELKRVLKKSGSYYLNLGDTYWGSGCGYGDYRFAVHPDEEKYTHYNELYNTQKKPQSKGGNGWLKPKQKMLMPYRVAIALQEDGWICRNDITWYKPNAMPSSVKDRLSCTTERIFHFVKSRKYYYDLDAIRVPHSTSIEALQRRVDADRTGSTKTKKDLTVLKGGPQFSTPGKPYSFNLQRNKTLIDPNIRGLKQAPEPIEEGAVHPLGKNPSDVMQYDSKYAKDEYGQTLQGFIRDQSIARERQKSWVDAKRLFPNDPEKQQEYINWIHDHSGHPQGKNPGDFWEINTQPFPDTHFAVYPEELVERIIKSSCPPDGVVLDPFAGSGTTGVVARRMNRRFILIELQPKYLEIMQKRLRLKEQLIPEVEIIMTL